LWASAFILLGLIVVQAGRSTGQWSNAARADVVARVGDLTMLTAGATSSEDIALVLDGRGEQLYVYRVKNRESLDFVRRYDLPTMFASGERTGAGKVR
jgi:hypothetical protein